MIHNRNACFNCGIEVDPGDYEYVGRTKIWICGDRDCSRALQEEQRGARDEARLDAEVDDYERYL